jgi:hypothetical protein
VHCIVCAHKEAFIARLADTCDELGVGDPDELGHQLAVLFEGAVALATTLNNTSPMVYARSAAAILIDESRENGSLSVTTRARL